MSAAIEKAVPSEAGADAPQGPEDDVHLTLMDHLQEFRRRLVYAAYAVVAGVGLGYGFADRIFYWLMAPVIEALPEGEKQLVFTSAVDPFFVNLKTSFYAGIFFASPMILYQLWAFVSPGLYRKERQLAAPFVVLGTAFFVGGGAFGRLLVLPYAFEYLVQGFADPRLRPMLDMSSQLDLVLLMVLGFGLIFELPLVLTLLALVGVVSSKFLVKYRRHAIVGNVVLAAVITPTGDPFNLALMAVPLIVCYEAGIVGARLVEKRKAARPAEEGMGAGPATPAPS